MAVENKNLLKIIKAGKCYVKINDDGDLVRIIDYCIRKDIRWIVESAKENAPDMNMIEAVSFEKMTFNDRVKLVFFTENSMFKSDFSDITDWFWSEVC